MNETERKRRRADQQAEYRRRRKLDPVKDAEHRAKEVKRVAKWGEENREKKNAWFAKRARTDLAKKREFLAHEKMKSGCVDCGYREHPAALDFDHVGDDKKFNLSSCGKFTNEEMREEIKKCVVRCSNCHRVETHRRLCEKHNYHDALQPIADHYHTDAACVPPLLR